MCADPLDSGAHGGDAGVARGSGASHHAATAFYASVCSVGIFEGIQMHLFIASKVAQAPKIHPLFCCCWPCGGLLALQVRGVMDKYGMLRKVVGDYNRRIDAAMEAGP